MSEPLSLNQRGQKILRDRERAKVEEHTNDILWVTSSPSGRRFLSWVLDGVCGLYGSSYSGGREDTFYREGRRSVGIELMRELQFHAPRNYSTMISEFVQVEDEAAQTRKAASEALDTEDDDA